MGAGQNKTTLTAANGLENTAAVCAYVYVSEMCVRALTTSLQKLHSEVVVGSEQEREPVANGFPIGPSLTTTLNKKWGATGEQLLENLRLHLLSKLFQRNGSRGAHLTRTD